MDSAKLCLLFVLLCLMPTGAWAGQAEVRDVAISNGCPPKKIEIYQQTMGDNGNTTYRVQCTLAKTVGPAAADNAQKMPDALLIQCTQNMCVLLRPVIMDAK